MLQTQDRFALIKLITNKIQLIKNKYCTEFRILDTKQVKINSPFMLAVGCSVVCRFLMLCVNLIRPIRFILPTASSVGGWGGGGGR